MGNNSSRMIVYGKTDKNSAMYTAMFGGRSDKTDSKKTEQKVEQKKAPQAAQKITIGHPEIGEKIFKALNPNFLPRPNFPSANVKPNFQKGGKSGGKFQNPGKIQLSPEELDTKARTKTMYNVQNIFKDLGDTVVRTTLGYLLTYTETERYDGSEIVLHIEQDLQGPQTSIIMSEEGDYLYEYIESQDSPKNTRRFVQQLVGQANAKAKAKGFEITFDGKNVFAKGDKKVCVYMKWALVDLLLKVYDEDDAWDE